MNIFMALFASESARGFVRLVPQDEDGRFVWRGSVARHTLRASVSFQFPSCDSSAARGSAAVRGLCCTIPWHKLALLSTEFRLQKTCGVYVSVYLISASDLGHSDTGEFWSFDWTRRDVAVKVECEIILGFLPSWSKEMWQRLQVIQSIGP